MTPWVYKNEVIQEEAQMPEKTLGFIYLITCLKNNKKYIGKKLVYFKKTSVKTVLLKNGTKKKKKVSALVPSDWKTYWGSSPNVTADIVKFGYENFTREILFFCENKGSLGYYEARLQMDERVLENQDLWYNGIISCRVGPSHIKPIL